MQASTLRNGQKKRFNATCNDTAGRNKFESIAYSLGNDESWVKYAGNAVVKKLAIRDFRDPKLSLYEEGKKWIMTLATKDRITFFSPPDLKEWTKESEFGEHAGVTWSNTGSRKFFLGWMINTSINSTAIRGKANIATPCIFTVSGYKLKDCSIIFFNENGEKLIAGYDKAADEYYIDRSNAAKADFKQGFAAKHTAPRFAKNNKLQLTIVLNAATAELFADGGLTVMTATFFPSTLLNEVQLPANKQLYLQATTLKSIWP